MRVLLCKSCHAAVALERQLDFGDYAGCVLVDVVFVGVKVVWDLGHLGQGRVQEDVVDRVSSVDLVGVPYLYL